MGKIDKTYTTQLKNGQRVEIDTSPKLTKNGQQWQDKASIITNY